MSEPVYRIDELQAKVFGLLKERGRHLSSGEVAACLNLPLWAVDRAMEAGLAAGQVHFSRGLGWYAVPDEQPEARTQADLQAGVVGGLL